jgi:SAM-dependent methyltransferase
MGPTVWSVLAKRWKDARTGAGAMAAVREIAADMWEFLKESTPQRKRSLYGDMEYDWEHESNTTSGGVTNRTRLLAALSGAPYQPTEPSLFREMLASVEIDFAEYTFVDLGSGKGRTLLMAAEFPFRRIVGVELFLELHQVAVGNIARSEHRERVEAVCMDARDYEFPAGPLLLYLFNPLPAAALEQVVENLRKSLDAATRPVRVIYHNPTCENVLAKAAFLRKVLSTHQYTIYSN